MSLTSLRSNPLQFAEYLRLDAVGAGLSWTDGKHLSLLVQLTQRLQMDNGHERKHTETMGGAIQVECVCVKQGKHLC